MKELKEVLVNVFLLTLVLIGFISIFWLFINKTYAGIDRESAREPESAPPEIRKILIDIQEIKAVLRNMPRVPVRYRIFVDGFPGHEMARAFDRWYETAQGVAKRYPGKRLRIEVDDEPLYNHYEFTIEIPEPNKGK